METLEGLAALNHAVELLTGKTAYELRNTPINEQRRDIEARLGRPVRVMSHFPFIGRGNVMRDRVITREQIERDLDKILR